MFDFSLTLNLPSNIKCLFPSFKRKDKDLIIQQDNNIKPKDLKDIHLEKLKQLSSCYYLIEYSSLFVLCWYDNLIEEKYETKKFNKTHLLKDLLPENKYYVFKGMIKKCWKYGYIKESYICNITEKVWAIYIEKLGEKYVLITSFSASEEDLEEELIE